MFGDCTLTIFAPFQAQLSGDMFQKPDRSPSFRPSNVLAPASARKFINAVGGDISRVFIQFRMTYGGCATIN